jgi:hypothetical protein
MKTHQRLEMERVMAADASGQRGIDDLKDDMVQSGKCKLRMVARCSTLSVSFLVVSSLVVNIAVLVAVCTVLVAFPSSERITFVWGAPTAGRGILLSIYFAILFMSGVLLAAHSRCADKKPVQHMVAAMLATQIAYKITTPITAGALNPVALSNLAISLLHAATLYKLWNHHVHAAT